MTQSPIYSANHVLEQLWDGTLPVDPVAIAQSLGAVVKPDATLGSVSGSLCYEDGTWVIRYNPSESAVRQRFTIAHEIGHLVMGHISEGETAHRDTTFESYNPVEAAANAFAAQLLMPENVVRMAHRLSPPFARHAYALANNFWVSERAMNIRMQQLGL